MKNASTRLPLPVLVVLVVLVVLAVLAPACGGSDTPATPTTTAAGPSAELFEGKLQGAGASAFYSFTVGTAGNVSVTLASVTTSSAPGSSTGVVLGIGLGTPLATDCNVTSQVSTPAGLAAQLTASNQSPAIYCVRIFDVGNLKVPINFAVRIVHT
jgi:hypothetical protein